MFENLINPAQIEGERELLVHYIIYAIEPNVEGAAI